MTEPTANPTADLRTDLIDALRNSRAIEREIFAALDPIERDTPPADGGWSPKDVQAHLAAWRRHQADRMSARREGRAHDDVPATETDAANAVFHAERADWPWDRVLADAEAATDALVAEVAAADDATVLEDRVIGATLGNGPEHDLGHLPALAARAGMGDRVESMAADGEAAVDRGGWPPRSTAFARYNLACFHALAGRLDRARALLRLALPANEELRTLAPNDPDLGALRDDLEELSRG